MRNTIFVLCLIFIVQLSAIINIPADHPTIQQGLDAAVTNDTILVASGTYYENINWPGVNGIKLIGSGEDDCNIDGNASGSVITFDEINGIVDTTTVIAGFKIRNGSADCGGGIYSFSASPTLRDLKVTANTASYDGGGLFCFNGSHFVLENVTISENIANMEGGGINCDFTSCIIINNCRITNNSANYSGGGICIEGGSVPIISYTLIANNSAEFGGGIWSGEKGACEVINCTIVNNTASVQGGGFHSYYATFSVINCIFWNNFPDQIFEDGYITYSDIQGGWAGMGNIDSDPMFVDAVNGDYNLTSTSPCIDSGDPASQYDLDNTIADMGCYYYDQLVGINDLLITVYDYKLSNYPNPFNPNTVISFQISEFSASEKVEIIIYNLKGQKVKSLHINRPTDQAINSVTWNGSDNNNKPVSSGIYLYKLKVGSKTKAVRKCLLLK